VPESWDDLQVLRSVEITASLVGPFDRGHFQLLRWERTLELSIDCFVCERVGRTTFLEWGAERAICSSDEEHGRHFAAARIAAFDVTHAASRVMANAIVDFWWAPFYDNKRNVRAVAVTEAPWARLKFGYHCPSKEVSSTGSTQTNLVRPCVVTCKHCEVDIVADEQAPTIRLLS
jgi:hypothetical protein